MRMVTLRRTLNFDIQFTVSKSKSFFNGTFMSIDELGPECYLVAKTGLVKMSDRIERMCVMRWSMTASQDSLSCLGRQRLTLLL